MAAARSHSKPDNTKAMSIKLNPFLLAFRAFGAFGCWDSGFGDVSKLGEGLCAQRLRFRGSGFH